MTRKSREVPPEMRTMGVQSVYRLFDSFGCFGGRHIGVVLFNQMIEVTQDAINQMNSILEKNGDVAVRYELKGGGCGGLLADWKTEPHHEPEQGEQVWPLAQGVFVIDGFTKEFIDGGVVNFDLTNFMPAFVVKVPGKGQCGCGSSFVA